jgi:hypothetical protein
MGTRLWMLCFVITLLLAAACYTEPLDPYCEYVVEDVPTMTRRIKAIIRASEEVEGDGLAYSRLQACSDPDGDETIVDYVSAGYEFTMVVDDLHDFDDLGKAIEELMEVSYLLPTESMYAPFGAPQWQLEEIRVTFLSGEENRFIRFPYDDANDKYQEGLRGYELFDTLNRRWRSVVRRSPIQEPS